MKVAGLSPRLSPAQGTTMATRRIWFAVAPIAVLAFGSGTSAAPLPPESHRSGPAGNEVRADASVAVDARDPRHLAQGDTVHGISYTAQVSNSHDGGLTWTTTASLPSLPGANSTAQTTVALAGGRLTAAYIGFHSVNAQATVPSAGGLAVTSSTDEGRHWNRPLLLQPQAGPCPFSFEPAMASSGKTVVLTWVNQSAKANCTAHSDTTLMVATSHDGGGHWRRQQLSFHSDVYNVAPTVAVDGRRAVVVARHSCQSFHLVQGCAPKDNSVAVFAYVSADAGDHFSAARRVAGDSGHDQLAVTFNHKTGAIITLTKQLSTRDPDPSPALIRDLHATFDDVPYASLDNGRTWHRKAYPLRVYLSATRPSLASSRDGTVAFLALVEEPSGFGENQPVLISTRDDGATWSCAELLDPRTFESGYSARTALAVGPDGKAHPVWPSAREYPVGPAETLFTAAVAMSPAPTSSLCAPL